MEGEVAYPSKDCGGFLRLNVSAPKVNAFYYVVTKNKERCRDGQVAIFKKDNGSFEFMWDGDGDTAKGELKRISPTEISVSSIIASKQKKADSFLASCRVASPSASLSYCECAFEVAFRDLDPYEFEFWQEMLQNERNDEKMMAKIETLIRTREGVFHYVNISVIRERTKQECKER
jgi:hypothetical protein